MKWILDKKARVNLFLIIGVIAVLIGLAGVAAVATHVAWVLFIVGLVLLIVHAAVRGRVPPAT